MQLSILRIILYILMPFGQLYARVRDFNGSLDKLYLMFPIFLMPPFSIIPILLMAFGFVAKGKGSSPYDHTMWIPIISRFFIAALCRLFIKNPLLSSFVIILVNIITIMIPNLYRRNKECKLVPNGDKPPFTLDGKQIFKTIANSIFELGFGYFVALLFNFIPFVGIAFKLITIVPVIGKFVNDIIWAVGFTAGYIIINMIDQQDMKNLCYPPTAGTKIDFFKIIFGIIFMIIGSVFSGGGKFGNMQKLSKLKKIQSIEDLTEVSN